MSSAERSQSTHAGEPLTAAPPQPGSTVKTKGGFDPSKTTCNPADSASLVAGGLGDGCRLHARGPPALKTIITFCSTDDRYGDDVHYVGGCHLTENLEWGSAFFAILPQPPDPQIVGERWRVAGVR